MRLTNKALHIYFKTSFEMLIYDYYKMISYEYNLSFEAQKIVDKYYDEYSKRFILSIQSGKQNTSHRDVSISLLRRVFSNIDCPTLEEISLQNPRICDQVIDVMLEFSFNNLKYIDLRKSQIGEQGVAKLIKKSWPALKYLGLNNNNIGDGGLQILLTSQLHNQLESLNLVQNEITSYGLRVLPTASLNNLKMLHLHQNNVGKTGVQYLAKSDLPQLEFLNLLDSDIENQAIKYLCKAQWINFKRLQIGYNGVTPDCLSYLEGATWKLEKLRTSFANRLCIHYFLSIIRLSSGQLQIKIKIKDDEMVEGSDTFINANVMLLQAVPYG